MRTLEVDHLIVGGNLLGLALADHLLRREAGVVLMVEAADSPAALAGDRLGAVVSTGRPQESAFEARSDVLLDEWRDYLEVDPEYRRCGAIVVVDEPFASSLSTRWELLDNDAARERANDRTLRDSATSRYAFSSDEGVLPRSLLASTLHWQVRRRGGRVLCDQRVESLEEVSGVFRFRAGARTGVARHVHLVGTDESLELARELSVPLGWSRRRWTQFECVVKPGEFGVLRLPRRHTGAIADRETREVDENEQTLLEFDADDDTGRASGAAEFRADDAVVWFDDGDGSATCLVYDDANPVDRETTVDWQSWAEVRDRLATYLPSVGEATVRHAVSGFVPALADGGPSPRVAADGRLLVAGAFGGADIPLALSVAEQMAEISLGQTVTLPLTAPS